MAALRRLPRSTPESAGIASPAVLEFVERAEAEIHELHSFMLVRHGSVVAEGWWKPYSPALVHHVFSLTKSFTATAVGLAIADGCLSLDDRVVSFFPGDVPDVVSENLAAMEIRHLLSMTTGHAEDSMPHLEHVADGNWPRAFLARPVEHDPGTHFLYDTGASHMLSTIVEQRTGQKLADYLRPRLFEPLGIEGYHWRDDPRGVSIGGFGLSVRTEDIAAFGELYLRRGHWNGEQAIPADWVDRATAKQTDNGTNPNSDWEQGYGYQFWRCRNGGYRGDGAFGQFCVVLPDRDAVLVMTGGLSEMQEPLELAWQTLLPAMHDRPLPEDAAAHSRLAARLADLAIEPPVGSATSAIAAAVGRRTYAIAPNEMGVETLRFEFGAGECLVRLHGSRGTATLEIGHGTWKPSVTAAFGEPEPVVAAGAWTADGRYLAVARRYLTPFHHTLEAGFEADTVRLEVEANVAFGPIRPLVLEGVAS